MVRFVVVSVLFHQIGDTVKVRIIEVDMQNRKLRLSMREDLDSIPANTGGQRAERRRPSKSVEAFLDIAPEEWIGGTVSGPSMDEIFFFCFFVFWQDSFCDINDTVWDGRELVSQGVLRQTPSRHKQPWTVPVGCAVLVESVRHSPLSVGVYSTIFPQDRWKIFCGDVEHFFFSFRFFNRAASRFVLVPPPFSLLGSLHLLPRMRNGHHFT